MPGYTMTSIFNYPHSETALPSTTRHTTKPTRRAGMFRQGSVSPALPKLRSACDLCHTAKIKCSGGWTCTRCSDQDLPCRYSFAMRAGKPKGSRNKKTLEKHAQLRQQTAAAAQRQNMETTTPWGMPATTSEATPFGTGCIASEPSIVNDSGAAGPALDYPVLLEAPISSAEPDPDPYEFDRCVSHFLNWGPGSTLVIPRKEAHRNHV